MPMETVVVVIALIAAFGFFTAGLLWADLQTRNFHGGESTGH